MDVGYYAHKKGFHCSRTPTLPSLPSCGAQSMYLILNALSLTLISSLPQNQICSFFLPIHITSRHKGRAGELFGDVCRILRLALVSRSYTVCSLGLSILTTLSEELFAGDLNVISAHHSRNSIHGSTLIVQNDTVWDRAISHARERSLQLEKQKRRRKGDIRSEIKEAAWRWFLSSSSSLSSHSRALNAKTRKQAHVTSSSNVPGGFSALLLSMKRHQSLICRFSALAEMCCRGSYEFFWLNFLRKTITDPVASMECQVLFFHSHYLIFPGSFDAWVLFCELLWLTLCSISQLHLMVKRLFCSQVDILGGFTITRAQRKLMNCR